MIWTSRSLASTAQHSQSDIYSSQMWGSSPLNAEERELLITEVESLRGSVCSALKGPGSPQRYTTFRDFHLWTQVGLSL